jgi:hypothetical protein
MTNKQFTIYGSALAATVAASLALYIPTHPTPSMDQVVSDIVYCSRNIGVGVSTQQVLDGIKYTAQRQGISEAEAANFIHDLDCHH